MLKQDSLVILVTGIIFGAIVTGVFLYQMDDRFHRKVDNIKLSPVRSLQEEQFSQKMSEQENFSHEKLEKIRHENCGTVPLVDIHGQDMVRDI